MLLTSLQNHTPPFSELGVNVNAYQYAHTTPCMHW